jgi:glycosyltransferase involved in cell wall biosynthesis
MHVVCVNYTFENFLTEPAALLERYRTTVGWANALAGAGVRVSVVQRFGSDAEITRNEVSYRFVRDSALEHGGLLDRPHRLHRTIRDMRPDIVHANGLHFARQALQLRYSLPRVPVLLQDHANLPPRLWVNRWALKKPLRRLDAVSFVSREQARPWLEANLLPESRQIVELMEGSSEFALLPRRDARAQSGLSGDPVCLWVGRLNENKDPLTVLRGFAQALPKMKNARLAMVYGSGDLLNAIHGWLGANEAAAAQVTLLGQQPHHALEAVYNSADLFLLGSHREGSGFAVLEALACGVIPVLPDIPSFRVLTGHGAIGKLWQTGNADELARALKITYSGLQTGSPQQVRRFFEANFSWPAIASQAIRTYRELIERMR